MASVLRVEHVEAPAGGRVHARAAGRDGDPDRRGAEVAREHRERGRRAAADGAAGTIPKSKARDGIARGDERAPSVAGDRHRPRGSRQRRPRDDLVGGHVEQRDLVGAGGQQRHARRGGRGAQQREEDGQGERCGARPERFALGGACPTVRGRPPSAARLRACADARSRAGSSSPAAIAACTAQPGSVSWRQSENRQPAASASTSAKAAATPTGSALMRGRRRPGVSISSPLAMRGARTARGATSCGARGRRSARISAVAW